MDKTYKFVPLFILMALTMLSGTSAGGAYAFVVTHRNNVDTLTSMVRTELPNATYTKENGTVLHSVDNHVSTAYTLVTATGNGTSEAPTFKGNSIVVYAVNNVQNTDNKIVYSSKQAVNFALYTQKDKLTSARQTLIESTIALVLAFSLLMIMLLI